jgi:hypothetical protein
MQPIPLSTSIVPAYLYKRGGREFQSQDYVNHIIRNQAKFPRDDRERLSFRAVQLDESNMRAQATYVFAMTERSNHVDRDALSAGACHCEAVYERYSSTEDKVGLCFVLATLGWINYRLACLSPGENCALYRDRAVKYLNDAKDYYEEEKRIYLTLARIAWHLDNNREEALRNLDLTEQYSSKKFVELKVSYERDLIRRNIRYTPRENPKVRRAF